MTQGAPPFIAIWQTSVSAADHEHWALGLALLPPEHRAYVLRYHFLSDQLLHLAGRLLVRRYMQRAGTLLNWDQWQYSQHGKPFLTKGPYFNISQTDNRVMVAFSSHPVGIDVESNQPLELQSLIGYLHCQEQDFIREAADQTAAFFWIWTRKEALLKAIGIGITEDLASHNCVEPVVRSELTWHLHSLAADSTHCTALATPLTGVDWQTTQIPFSLLLCD